MMRLRPRADPVLPGHAARAGRRIVWEIFAPDQLELVEIRSIDQMDLRLEHAVKGATMLLQDRFERFEAMTGLRGNQRGTGFAEALVGHDRVPRIVEGIDRGRE